MPSAALHDHAVLTRVEQQQGGVHVLAAGLERGELGKDQEMCVSLDLRIKTSEHVQIRQM